MRTSPKRHRKSKRKIKKRTSLKGPMSKDMRKEKEENGKERINKITQENFPGT